MIDIAKIEKLMGEATPGRWYVEALRGYRSDFLKSPECKSNPHNTIGEFDCEPKDAELCAELHNSCAAMIAEIRAGRKLRDALLVVVNHRPMLATYLPGDAIDGCNEIAANLAEYDTLTKGE